MDAKIHAEMRKTIAQFAFSGELQECIPFGSGHINDTYRLTFQEENGPGRYILQKMNKEVFRKPAELMENICGVTTWLRRKIREDGGDEKRETLNVVPTRAP